MRLFLILGILCLVPLGSESKETAENSRVLKRLQNNLGQMLFGKEVTRRAADQLGKPYRWGGDDPEKGFDCSGYTQWVFKTMGVVMPRSAAQQFRGGIHVEKASVLPGDLVFFFSDQSPSRLHVGIYNGNGNFLHAPSSGKNIQQDSLQEGYWKARWHGVRRWIPIPENKKR